MKTTVYLNIDPIDVLEVLLVDQQATGDAEGAARTRSQIVKIKERRRLREQALRSGRWPFVVSKPEGNDDGESERE